MKRGFSKEENVRKILEGEGGLENEDRGPGGLTYDASAFRWRLYVVCVYVNVPMYESKIYAVAKVSIFQAARLFITTLLHQVFTLDP